MVKIVVIMYNIQPADLQPGKIKEHHNFVTVPRPGDDPSAVDELYFCPPSEVPMHLSKLMSWCQENENTCNFVKFLTILQYNFLRIHPFEDTNGRMSRILMVFYSMRNDYPPINIEAIDKQAYFRVLTIAHKSGDLLPLGKFLGRALIKSHKRVVETFGEQKYLGNSMVLKVIVTFARGICLYS